MSKSTIFRMLPRDGYCKLAGCPTAPRSAPDEPSSSNHNEESQTNGS